jgi:hypothetical protein
VKDPETPPSQKKSIPRSRSKVTQSFAEEVLSSSRRLSISDVYEEQEREIAKSEGRESVGSRSFGSSISSAHEEEVSVEERMREFFGPKSSDYIQEMR